MRTHRRSAPSSAFSELLSKGQGYTLASERRVLATKADGVVRGVDVRASQRGPDGMGDSETAPAGAKTPIKRAARQLHRRERKRVLQRVDPVLSNPNIMRGNDRLVFPRGTLWVNGDDANGAQAIRATRFFFEDPTAPRESECAARELECAAHLDSCFDGQLEHAFLDESHHRHRERW